MTCANVQNVQKKNGKLPAKTVEDIARNKIFVDLIGPYKKHKKGKEPIILKVVILPKYNGKYCPSTMGL